MVLIILNRLNSFVKLVAIKRKTWAEIEKKLTEEWISVFGKPEKIFLDNVFDGKASRSWSEKQEVVVQFCSAHDHRQIGTVERFHRYLGIKIWKECMCTLEKGQGLAVSRVCPVGWSFKKELLEKLRS